MPGEKLALQAGLSFMNFGRRSLMTKAEPAIRNGLAFFSRAFSTDKTKATPEIKPEVKPPIVIPREKMRPLKEWSDEHRLELMFATKEGLPVRRFPINHSAAAFHDPSKDFFAIYGRQSPWDITNWFRDGITFRTMMDNEANYLHPKFQFKAHPTGVFLTKDEINQLLKKTDELINKPQTCNMVTSNCYSASTTVMTLAIDTLLKRPKFNAEEIDKLLTVLSDHPMKDHFSFGVKNNPVVMDTLKSVLSSVSERSAKIPSPSAIEKALHQKTKHLLEELAEENLELERQFRTRDMLGM
ncbi:hypothetical protein [Legionella micdadei]|uniref:hypothetical protein n=1 Tax=Legionella micdadei TaxID=451 RepID=UPI0009EF7A71|nr:hypothetical protein [Legionella micdadei]ARH00411.1 hypothetical protein B6V88_08235 [Legionella micdadei]